MAIKLGFEVETGKEIGISPSHMIVTGVSQLAGKTTCLESLIKRSGKKAIVFRTKIGEKSFLDGNNIQPYYKDKADWRYIESLIEATMQQKLRSFDRSKIIQLAKTSGSNTLIAFKKKVDERLLEKKLSGFEKDILTNIQAYLEIVLPKLQSIKFADSLALVEGLNIMDLERFSQDPEVQSLVIRSTVEEVLYNHKDVIIVVPECWKFLPEKRGNPCKQIVEEFIRQGATNRNFIWLDSQELASVSKTILKQVTEWILGYQSEKNEVKHTLDQLPLPKSAKPKEDDIMSLGTGMFFYATREKTSKVYAQPFWLDDERAMKVALGMLAVKDLDKPKVIVKPKPKEIESIDSGQKSHVMQPELKEIVLKIAKHQDEINELTEKLNSFEMKLTLQGQNLINGTDIDSIVSEVLSRMPKPEGGNIVYQVSPIEKIKKDFILEAKNKILSDVSQINEEAKKMSKYIETRGVEVKINELLEKCFFMSANKSSYKKIGELGGELTSIGVAKKGTHAGYMPLLKERIISLLAVHEATEQEIQNLYDHIMMELLTEKKVI